MPNTPAQVGMSMTVAVPNPHVGDVERGAVDALLAAIGDVAWIEDEALLDAVTAVSGSGPAYVFLLAECLAEAAREAGLPDELADAARAPDGGGRRRASRRKPALARRAAQERHLARRDDGGGAGGADGARAGCSRCSTRAVAAAKKRSIELG